MDNILISICQMRNEENSYHILVLHKQKKISELDSVRKAKAVSLKRLHTKERNLSRSILIKEKQIEKLNKRIERIIYLQMRKSKINNKSKRTLKSNSAFAKLKELYHGLLLAKRSLKATVNVNILIFPVFSQTIMVSILMHKPLKLFLMVRWWCFYNSRYVNVAMIKHDDFFTTYSTLQTA